MQRAVGWSLKELNNVYPKLTLRYLEGNIMDVSAMAFTAAIEKLENSFAKGQNS